MFPVYNFKGFNSFTALAGGAFLARRVGHDTGKREWQGQIKQYFTIFYRHVTSSGRQWVRFGLASSGGDDPPVWELTWARKLHVFPESAGSITLSDEVEVGMIWG
jgi:hypothetical protein